MHWINVKNKLPEDDIRVITFSPVYKEGHVMRFRIMNGQFVRISTEVTHWSKLKGPIK